MYLLEALERFAAMPAAEVKKVGYEIAMLGTKGIDINDPTAKYSIKTFPGDYSGLRLLCFEYVSFKQIDPSLDIGFDLSKEYASALLLRDSRPKG
jgi:hypothetical protein